MRSGWDVLRYSSSIVPTIVCIDMVHCLHKLHGSIGNSSTAGGFKAGLQGSRARAGSGLIRQDVLFVQLNQMARSAAVIIVSETMQERSIAVRCRGTVLLD